jgi:hypothetical protein
MTMSVPLVCGGAVALTARAVTAVLAVATPATLPQRQGDSPAATGAAAWEEVGARLTVLPGLQSPFTSCWASAWPLVPPCPLAP